ncbi:hypothetical protein PoB_001889300 [Plakobranchus ocellatus]|uniref:Uncharacterized protein n=1 Tax=Plakobranchus ocellatus TaxID=259542 RepID=A0AAV3ZCC5_9GAST|nr:hypothetical protein PoB_001889300 [Plakobranchus ocellatus]
MLQVICMHDLSGKTNCYGVLSKERRSYMSTVLGQRNCGTPPKFLQSLRSRSLCCSCVTESLFAIRFHFVSPPPVLANALFPSMGTPILDMNLPKYSHFH